MNKELFIESIESIKQQLEYDKKCNDAFGIILPNDYISGYDNHLVIEQLIKVLRYETLDDNDWIGHFIWELDFGSKWYDGCITDNGKNIKMKTTEDLWEMLDKEANEK